MKTEILSTLTLGAVDWSGPGFWSAGPILRQSDIRSLHPLRRLFLTSDGSLTDLLEATFLEPICALRLAQMSAPAAQNFEPLDVSAGEPLLHRRVLLQGCRTGANYVYAESVLAVNRLPLALVKDLFETDTPLGRLWKRNRLAVSKRTARYWSQRAGELSTYFGTDPDGFVLARTSFVSLHEGPAMMITEYFSDLVGTARTESQ